MSDSSPKMQVVVALIAAISAILVAVISKSDKTPAEPRHSDLKLVRGRVVEAVGLQAVDGARVTFDSPASSATNFTDHEGTFGLQMDETDSGPLGRLRIEASGFEVYEREVSSAGSLKRFEQIRLVRLPGSGESSGNSATWSEPRAQGIELPPGERLVGIGPLPDSIRQELNCEGCLFQTTGAVAADLNDDGMRELLFCYGGGSCGATYWVYSWSREDRKWKSIGLTCSSDLCEIAVLETRTLGYLDVNAGGAILKFNGIRY